MVYFEVTAPSGLKIRQLPSGASAVLEAMPEGMRVRRLDDTLWNGDWYKILAEFSDRYQVQGYSHQKYLAPIEVSAPLEAAEPAPPPQEPPAPDDIYKVIPSSLRLREQASTDSRILMNMPSGTIVTKLGSGGSVGWWRVSTASGSMQEEGYAYSKHLRPYNPQPAKKFDLSLIADASAILNKVQQFVGDYASGLTEDLLVQLNNVMTQYEINANSKRFNHFIAQLAHESANFSRLDENLNYSAPRLWEIFSSKFENEEEAASFAGQPERIANRVYANRIGNGDESSGDGWRYRGRGYIQLTGRANYREIGERIGVDLENNPDLVMENPTVALQVAADYWDSRNINLLADQDDVYAVTKKINGGYNGIDHRKDLLQFAKSIWGV